MEKGQKTRKERALTSGCSDDDNTWLLLADSDRPQVSEDEGIVDIVSCFNYLFDPNNRFYTYTIVAFISLIHGISSYIIDLPGGIQTTIIRVMRLDDSHYDMLFSAFTWVDIVMSIAGTVIVNQYIGVHVGFIVFLSIVLVGQLLCSVGCFLNTFWIFLIGRIVIGSGTGTVVSILVSFLVLWFEGKEITFVMSLPRCMARLAATLALFTPQLAYNSMQAFIRSPLNRLGATQMVGTVLCILTIFCASCVILLDKRGTRIIGRKHKKKEIHISDAFRFPFSFWLVALEASLVYAVFISFTANGPLFFISRYGLSTELANLANSLSYGAVVVISPFVGLTIDFMGYHLMWGYVGIWLGILSFLLYITGSETSIFIPFLSATLSSCSYAFIGAAIWVCPGLVVEKHQVTTAYGVAMSIYALAVSVIGIVAGVIIDNFGYLMLILYYILIFFFASLLAVHLYMMELCSERKVLNMSGKTRRQLKHNCK